ncbi:MAG: ChaB family protein [Hyphomicrobiaceae bacterium]|nr:ChaB family protein [Hyphomicrobiaceae bacterium]
MPYAHNEDLPPGVRSHLPPHAQSIFRGAFNGAWHAHADEPAREALCHRIAWAAVKRHYRKQGDHWVPIDPGWEP